MSKTKEIRCINLNCKSTKEVNKFGPKNFRCPKCTDEHTPDNTKPKSNLSTEKVITCVMCKKNTFVVPIFSTNFLACKKCQPAFPEFCKDLLINEIESSEFPFEDSGLTERDFIYFHCLKMGFTLSPKNYVFKTMYNMMIQPVFVTNTMYGVLVCPCNDSNMPTGAGRMIRSVADLKRMNKEIKKICATLLEYHTKWQKTLLKETK